jgi:hypothetical protein
MKLLSPAEFVYKNGQFHYLDRPMTAPQINVKSRLTLIFSNQKVVLSEGIYTLEDLKKKVP